MKLPSVMEPEGILPFSEESAEDPHPRHISQSCGFHRESKGKFMHMHSTKRWAMFGAFLTVDLNTGECLTLRHCRLNPR